jgi:hypothetical protein
MSPRQTSTPLIRKPKPTLKVEFKPATLGRRAAGNDDNDFGGQREVRVVPISGESGRPAWHDLEFALRWVSEALTAELGSRHGDVSEPHGAPDLVLRVRDALDRDIKVWAVEIKRFGPDFGPEIQAGLTRMVKTWGKQAAPDRQLLLTRVMGAADDPGTLQTAYEDVGPRPTVSVSLRVPGSYLYGSSIGPLNDVDLAIVYRAGGPVADDLEYVTRALTPDVAFPSPAVVLQARRNAEARTAMLEEFGALTATDVAALAGSTAKNTSALAGRWRRDGRVLAVEHHGASLYPGFQFTDTGQPRPVVEAVLKYLREDDASAWQQALWFLSANGWLDGRRPVDLLATDPELVVRAAAEAVREPVG